MTRPSSRKRGLPASCEDDDTAQSTPKTKRVGKAPSQAKKEKVKKEEEDSDEEEPEPEPKPKPKPKPQEKRLRRFRPKPPASFNIVYERAIEQRFYVLSRTRCGVTSCPEEDVEIAGSTGNVYTVQIAQVPSCNCPHALNGNQCKHIIYVMSRVLRARFDLVYQLALLSTELCEIFAKAPPIHPDIGEDGKAQDGKRKEIEGDCPICYTPLEEAEAIVYCRATCGQNIHKECFDMWAKTKNQSGRGGITCPMCRSEWQVDEEEMLKDIKNKGVVNADGYVNVADQLGISRVRDSSTYYHGPRFGHSFHTGRRSYMPRSRR